MAEQGQSGHPQHPSSASAHPFTRLPSLPAPSSCLGRKGGECHRLLHTRDFLSCSSSLAVTGGVKNREVRGKTGNKFHYLRFFSSISIDESKENTANPIQTVSRWWPLIEKK